MASDEAKVKVRLDTRQAKGELRGLTREGGKTAGRVGAGIRSAMGRGLGAMGLGVGIGAAMATLKGPTQSGIVASIDQTLGPLANKAAQALTPGGRKTLALNISRKAALERLMTSGYAMARGLAGGKPVAGERSLFAHLTKIGLPGPAASTW